jgi:hypothetical protein
MWHWVQKDDDARLALDFLAEKEGTLPKTAHQEWRARKLLQAILAVLPLEYLPQPANLTPPARKRKAEIDKLERDVVKVRDVEKMIRRRSAEARRLPRADYFAPRTWKGAYIQVPNYPDLATHPELEPSSEMLKQIASSFEKDIKTLRQCAKEEPTKKQWQEDYEARVSTLVKDRTGHFYHERVAAILEALRPPPSQAKGRKAETLQKRTYRRRKSRPN